jgi:hypothetical protein
VPPLGGQLGLAALLNLTKLEAQIVLERRGPAHSSDLIHFGEEIVTGHLSDPQSDAASSTSSNKLLIAFGPTQHRFCKGYIRSP